MVAVHNRMSLILKPDELEEWVFDDKETEYFLKKVPVLLKNSTDYQQMSLF